jgi:speckle-type POZ protein
MQGMRHAWEVVQKEMRGREETNQRAAFLQQGFALAWKEGMHTDIVVKPGTGPPIQAHKAILVSGLNLDLPFSFGMYLTALLKPSPTDRFMVGRAQAARSEVLRHVLSGDDEHCVMMAPAGDSISLPELSHDELSLLLGFLYTGALEEQQQQQGQEEEELPAERHLHALLVAADKYDVPFLRRACEARLAARVEPRNVLRTLEVAELSSSAVLRERAMGTVVEHAEQVVFSAEFEEFAVRNAGLCVEITRALLTAANMSPATKPPCIEDV